MRKIKYYMLATALLLSLSALQAQQTKALRVKKEAKPETAQQAEPAKQVTKAEAAPTPTQPGTSNPLKATRIKLDKKAAVQQAKEEKDARLHQTELQNQNAERRPLPPQPATGAEAKPSTPKPEKPAGIRVKNPKSEPVNSKTGPKPKNKHLKESKEAKAE
ncbi:MAG: hypothetical protein PWR20_2343 [Bacteroidales bacterium]|jgi:hypothetical protein|nr:hypothetical protein [Bacteroidales bacterium]MDN5330687.1 hypothetical protein [Bacteroidales bacterium]